VTRSRLLLAACAICCYHSLGGVLRFGPPSISGGLVHSGIWAVECIRLERRNKCN